MAKLVKKYIGYHQWWQWAKLVAVAVLPMALTGNPLVVGIIVHLLCDFTLQSGQTAMCKGDRGRHLFVHALCAGALPGAVAGIVASGPVGALVGAVVGFSSHYAVDYTRKFGISDWRKAIVADQLCHIVALIALVV